MRQHLPILFLWGLAYLALVAFGTRVGLKPVIVFLALLVLFVPPFYFCLHATRNVLHRVRLAFPEQWNTLNRDWVKLELRLFLFDDQTLGDHLIAVWKHELRWWVRVGIIALLLFLPTLLLIEKLSK
jgi:hypothetical protein